MKPIGCIGGSEMQEALYDESAPDESQVKLRIT